jgi:hypothetical protein
MHKIGVCRLCLRKTSLCASHIIPEFLWKHTYDDKHRVEEMGPEKRKAPWLQKGLRERLLCSPCEQYLNRFETYFNNVWFARGLPAPKISGPAICIRGFDYVAFRLFHLSVLWRASIASLPQFASISLSDEDSIRKMILRGQPGVPGQYGILANALVDPTTDQVLHGIVTSPSRTIAVDGKHVGYDFIFGGCLWRYLSDVGCATKSQSIIFQSDGALTVIRFPVTECEAIMTLMSPGRG